MRGVQETQPRGSDLFFLAVLQVPPLMHCLGQVNTVHGDLNLPNDIVLPEAIEIKHLEHQSLPSKLSIWDL